MHTCVCLLFAPRALQNGASGGVDFLVRQRTLQNGASGEANIGPARAIRLQRAGNVL
jgi:hypothetical protein